MRLQTSDLQRILKHITITKYNLQQLRKPKYEQQLTPNGKARFFNEGNR